MKVPLFATNRAVEPLLPAIEERQRAVLQSGRYILGPELERFEAEFAVAMGCRHCIGVGNGTDAITIALRALGVRPGDEVIVPAFTFIATPEAVVNAGATPVFCDIDPATDCMTTELAERAITPRTRALVPVHIFGNPAPMRELAELARTRSLALIADAAQAAGARIEGSPVGAFGDAATFSFYPSKNLGAFGDAGAIVTDSEDVALAARRLRTHGSLDKEAPFEELGYNSRLDEMQAAALRVLLPHLPEWTDRRRWIAANYAERGLGEIVELPTEAAGAESAYHLYVIRSERRDQIHRHLSSLGIGSRPYYTIPMHLQPSLRGFAAETRLPNCERLSARGLALPMGPALDSDQIDAVIAGAQSVA